MEAPTLAARRPIGQRLFVGVLLLVFVGFGIQYTFKALNHRSAFLRWREQILQLDGETNIYQRYAYPNPPIMALLLRPLAEMEPPLVGALAWFVLKVIMALLALAAVFRMIEAGGVPFPPWARALTALLSLRPIAGDLSHGNVNIFILFLVIGALYAWHKQRDFLAGLLLALAVCCKVTPALFVPYFIWKRQWNLLLGWATGMVLFLIVVPGAILGWHDNWTNLNSWVNQMVVPYMLRGEVTSEHPNQSLPGAVARLLTHSPSFCAYPNDIYTPTDYHNVADIGRDGARWLVRLCQGAFALMVVLLCRTPRQVRGGWRLAAELAIVMVGMLLFSERTWKHHCVTLMLPFAVLVYAIATVAMSRARRGLLIAALVLTVVLMLSTSGMMSDRAADLMQVYAAYTAAFLVLLAGLLAVCSFAGASLARPQIHHGDNLSLTQPVAVNR